MEDGEKPRAPRERLRFRRVGREGLLIITDEGPRMRVARMGGQAVRGSLTGSEQQSEPAADMQSEVPEAESPRSDEQ